MDWKCLSQTSLTPFSIVNEKSYHRKLNQAPLIAHSRWNWKYILDLCEQITADCGKLLDNRHIKITAASEGLSVASYQYLELEQKSF